MKTNELTGAALDWAVAKCEGYRLDLVPEGSYTPSTDWAQGGPIIEREKIDINATLNQNSDFDEWRAVKGIGRKTKSRYGPTPLIAAMRCYVSSKLGDDVEIPKELL